MTGQTRCETSSGSPLARCVIVVVAYEAESTIVDVLDRIPGSVASSIGAVIVSDDSSRDATAHVARRWSCAHPAVDMEVVRQPVNLGYGGNQRFCYRWVIEHGFDHAVMIHGDGQYAPERVGDLFHPLLHGTADAVFGSRMLEPDGARRGGMPLYKRVGNRVLTSLQNRATGLDLSEWHTGYRGYSMASMRRIALPALSSGFDFDTEIILAMHDVGARITEIPIATHYGDEECRVNGIRYAIDVTRDVLRYRRRTRGR